MEILSPRTRKWVDHFQLQFTYIGAGGIGCAFNCDKDGNVDLSKLQPAALATYKEAMSGKVVLWTGCKYQADEDGEYHRIPGTGHQVTYTVSEGSIVNYGAWHTEPAVGKCNHCGRKVYLYGFTNTCDCGTDYNMSGQELAHRSQWGEETGETLADILGIE